MICYERTFLKRNLCVKSNDDERRRRKKMNTQNINVKHVNCEYTHSIRLTTHIRLESEFIEVNSVESIFVALEKFIYRLLIDKLKWFLHFKRIYYKSSGWRSLLYRWKTRWSHKLCSATMFKMAYRCMGSGKIKPIIIYPFCFPYEISLIFFIILVCFSATILVKNSVK